MILMEIKSRREADVPAANSPQLAPENVKVHRTMHGQGPRT
jgi:hypothetical protein